VLEAEIGKLRVRGRDFRTDLKTRSASSAHCLAIGTFPTFSVNPSCRRWFGFRRHKFGISLDFEAVPSLKTKADSCLAEGKNDGTRKLSGDGKTYGSDKTW